MAVGAGGGFGARLAALFAGEGPALVVRDGALRAARAFTAAQAHERVESGTRIAIAAGASIGAGTRIELLGGAVSIGAGARIGEGVVLRPSGSISICAGCVVEDLAQLESDLAGAASPLSLGDGTRGLYEPIHGSAPDLAGKGVANPCGASMSKCCDSSEVPPTR